MSLPERPVVDAERVLVGRAQLGDRRALDRLLASVQAPLHRHLRHLLGDEHAADDALQDALLAISRRLGTLRDPRWFRAWAFRVATRTALRQARRAHRRLEVLDDDALADAAAPEPEPRFEPELVALIGDALGQVPPASQVVLRLHYLEGLTQLEVAEALGLSPGTVKSRLSYGLAWLRRLVQPVRD